MPLGGFLDTLPASLFVTAHIIFLLVGAWAAMKAKDNNLGYSGAFWLYVVTQLIFLAFFGKWFTLKLAVLLEQTFLVIMVIWISVKAKQS